MGDDLSTNDDVMAALEGKAIRTKSGTFFREEDVRRLVEKRQTARELDKAEAPRPKTMLAARRMAAEYLKDKLGPQPAREAGRSLSATAPHSSSRT